MICEVCKLPHADALLPEACIEAQSKAMLELLKNVSQIGTCQGCYAVIAWVRHRNGKMVPYTTEGLNHFVNCPAREQFGQKAAG